MVEDRTKNNWYRCVRGGTRNYGGHSVFLVPPQCDHDHLVHAARAALHAALSVDLQSRVDSRARRAAAAPRCHHTHTLHHARAHRPGARAPLQVPARRRQSAQGEKTTPTL